MKLSLRDLLWLVLVVALALGWWLQHRRISDALAEGRKNTIRLFILERVLKEEGYLVYWLSDQEGLMQRELDRKESWTSYSLEYREADRSRVAREGK